MSQIFTQIRSLWANPVLLKAQNPTYRIQFSYLNNSVNKCCLIWSTTFTSSLYLTLRISFFFQDATLFKCTPCVSRTQHRAGEVSSGSCHIFFLSLTLMWAALRLIDTFSTEKFQWTNSFALLSCEDFQFRNCYSARLSRNRDECCLTPIDWSMNYPSFLYKSFSSLSQIETVQFLLEGGEKSSKVYGNCLFPYLVNTVPKMFSSSQMKMNNIF